MSSIDIFVDNLNRIAKNNKLHTYGELAAYLNVTEDALKHWQNKSRSPSLQRIDEIADKIHCHSYSLYKQCGSRKFHCERIVERPTNPAFYSHQKQSHRMSPRFLTLFLTIRKSIASLVCFL